MNIRIALLVGICVMDAGCAGMDVTDDGKSPSGIPFYVKEAVVVQQTKVQTVTMKVSFELAEEKGGKATATIPESGPISIQENDTNKKLVENLKSGGGDHAISDKDKLIAELLTKLEDLESIADKTEKEETIENSWKVDTVIGPKRYYIRTRTPLVGTATSDFTLNPDGTLSKASSTVTDQTLSTLLSPVPITSLFEKAVQTSSTSAAPTRAGVKPQPRRTTKTFYVRLVVTEVPTVYTLQKVFKPEGTDIAALDSCSNKTCPALKLSTARQDANDNVQIVSRTVGGGAKEKDGDKDKSYQFAGSLTPPAPAKKGAEK